ncbi:MAG: hypothetical protein RBT37_06480 [Dissulfurispiraceae bacterium]|jgi:hypothetical protein|nr:hypothetical protein [Dissulfurispiraceae bacterium]
MIITGSDIKMSSMHSFEQKKSVKEDLRIWFDSPEQGRDSRQAFGIRSSEKISISEKSKEMLHAKTKGTESADLSVESPADNKTFIIKLMIEALTGKKIRILGTSDLQNQDKNDMETLEHNAAQQADASGQQREGWGLVYNYEATHMERERMAFNAQGVINTADEEKIKFNLNLKMDRAFISTESVDIRMGDAARVVDPLVINFNGSAAELTSTKFEFDLDSDGTMDKISFVGPNSGILVFDKNNDGMVNNGSELFGPATGNGFNELAAYDDDGNNWIDQNDAVYESLRIWTKTNNGEDLLRTLTEAGVAAIGLQNLETQFSLTDASNNLNGQLARTGLYVSADRTVGTVQQVDLVI